MENAKIILDIGVNPNSLKGDLSDLGEKASASISKQFQQGVIQGITQGVVAADAKTNIWKKDIDKCVNGLHQVVKECKEIVSWEETLADGTKVIHEVITQTVEDTKKLEQANKRAMREQLNQDILRQYLRGVQSQIDAQHNLIEIERQNASIRKSLLSDSLRYIQTQINENHKLIDEERQYASIKKSLLSDSLKYIQSQIDATHKLIDEERQYASIRKSLLSDSLKYIQYQIDENHKLIDEERQNAAIRKSLLADSLKFIQAQFDAKHKQEEEERKWDNVRKLHLQEELKGIQKQIDAYHKLQNEQRNMSKLQKAMINMGNSIKKFTTNFVNNLKAAYGNLAESGANAINQLTNTMASGSGSIIQGITTLMSTIGGLIATGIGGPIAGSITSSIISIFGNIAQIIVNIVKGIINIVVKLINGAINTIKKIFNGIKNIFSTIPSMVEKFISKLANLSTTFKVLSSSINYTKSILKQFISMIGYKFNAYSIVNFTKECFSLGSSLTEQYHILKVVTPSFVAYQDSLNKTSQYSEYMSDVTQRLGISTINATRYMAGYASMWKSLGIQSSESITSMSQDMLQLTSDLASFKDMDYDDVFKSLRSVIFGGQTRTGLNMGVDIYVDSMKKYLASLNVTIDDSDEAMQKFTKSLGKSWENLSGAEKSALRLKKVMRDLKFMYGDFANTSYTWANQTRLLKEQFSNLKAVIGENLIMVFNSLLIVINKVLSAISKLAYAMNSFLKSLGLGKVLESAGANISSALGDETDALEDAADGVGGAGSNAAKEIQRSLLGFDKLMNNLSKDSDSSSSGGGSGANTTNLGAFDFGQDKDKVDEIETYMSKAIENLKLSLKKVSKFFKTLWEDFQTYFAKPFGEFLQGENGIPRLINNLATLIDGIDWNTLNVAFRRWFDSLEPLAEFIFNVGADIQEYLINPLIRFFTNKIIPKITNALTKFNNAVDWEKVRTGISNVAKALVPVIERIIEFKTTIFEKILLPIGEWFLNTAWPYISDAITSTLNAIKRIWDALSPSLKTFYDNVLVPFAQTIGKKICDTLQGITDYMNGIDTKWIDDLKDKLGKVEEPLEDFFDSLSEFDLGSAFDALCVVIETADEEFGITKTLSTMLGKVFDAAFGDDGLVLEHIIPKLSEALDILMNSKFVQEDIPFALSQLVEVCAPAIFQIGYTLGQGILGGISNALMGEDLSSKMGAIDDYFENSDMNGFEKFMTRSSNGILGIIDRTFGTNFIDEVYDEMKANGSIASEGFEDGINSKLDTININTSGFISNQFGNEHVFNIASEKGNETRDNYVNNLSLDNVDGSSLVTSYSSFLKRNMGTENEKIKTSVDNASNSIIKETKSSINLAINDSSTQVAFSNAGHSIGDKICSAIKEKLTNQEYWKSAFSKVASTMNTPGNFYEYSKNNKSLAKSIVPNVNQAANGAYVHATPGGQFFQVAEAGQNEVIAPEPMLRKIVREEMGNNGGFNSTQPIILQLDDGSILGQYVVNFINGEVKRTGKKLI